MEEHKKSPFILKLVFIALSLLHCIVSGSAVRGGRKGQWQLLLNSTGVVAMHMALTHHNTVVMYDQTGSGPSNYRLRRRYNGTRCTLTRNSLWDPSCYAHSVEYDVSRNKIRPLRLDTDTWCSSGAFLSDGTLVQAGGYGDGGKRIRYFKPCDNGRCDWRQSKALLENERWYASTQILPEKDRVIIVGGRRAFTYEFVPKLSSRHESINLPFLSKTFNRKEGGENLYPFLHLSSDGNLFIFANRDSILFNYKRNKVVKSFPRIPGGGSRNYPSSGSSVMLPLDHANGFKRVEIMVCGGAAPGAYRATKEGRYLNGLRTCGRIVITGNKPRWKMENMPKPRLLNDMLMLPTGHILIINGARRGCAGYGNAKSPSLQPFLYKPNAQLGKRFSVLKSTKIARMYHSSALLLPNGKVLVAGGNPHRNYTFRGVSYPTELRLQAFTPRHMSRQFDHLRPRNVTIHYGGNGGGGVGYGEEFDVRFWLVREHDDVAFSAYAPPFVTHSVSMNQRMLRLKCKSMVRREDGKVSAVLEAPPSSNVAPAGHYLLSVVNSGIPSESQWVKFLHR